MQGNIVAVKELESEVAQLIVEAVGLDVPAETIDPGAPLFGGEGLGLDSTRGAIVARVHPNSPAEAAGLQPNDVIVKFGPTAVDDYHHLQRLSSDAEPGTSVPLEIVRKRSHKTLTLKIAESPDSSPVPQPSAPPGSR